MAKKDKPFWKKIPGRDIKDEERQFLMSAAADIANRFDDQRIVNIGVKGGTSLHCLCIGAPKARFLAIDIDLSRSVYMKDRLPDNVRFVEADSTSYPIDEAVHLLFVDGGHFYDTVWGDIQNWTPHIPIGGIVIFHDYRQPGGFDARLRDVRKAVDTWRWENDDCWSWDDIVGSMAVLRRYK